MSISNKKNPEGYLIPYQSVAYNISMNPNTASKINALNLQFYQSFADDFSETRLRLQPGVVKLMERLLESSRILDLGCGNGRLAQALLLKGFSGSYLGLDFSPNLLDEALRNIPPDTSVRFSTQDLNQSPWDIPPTVSPFDAIVCFAVMHHIPGNKARQRFCRTLRGYLSSQGSYFLSNWQFLKSDRFQDRIIPWEKVGLSEDEVDEGDYLIDWRRGGSGIRYVHHFSENELIELADLCGFRVRETFFSDGKEGNLSIYQVWEPV
jgi:2-polyprenyl-3-methyl-5-hydroxy-6-metoxy-1,4-benzoquinol methylase